MRLKSCLLLAAVGTLLAAAFLAPHAAMALVGGPRPVAVAVAVEEPEHTWRDSAVLAIKLDSPVSSGSAVPVACRPSVAGFEVILLTCAHVAEDMVVMPGRALLGGRELGPVEVLKMHDRLDVAIVRLFSAAPLPVVPLRLASPDVTEDVWAAGYPGGGDLVITHGVVGSRKGASASAFPGNSGGPVVDCRGRLVGIVAMVRCSRTFGLVCHDMRFEAVPDFYTWVAPFL